MKQSPSKTTSAPSAVRLAFPAALLLTGNMHDAEQAVENAITASGSDFTAEALLVETVRSVMQLPTCRDETHSILPRELQALSLLPPKGRNCFVLRVLLGIEREACTQILELSGDDVDEALHQALLDLPLAAGTCRLRQQFQLSQAARAEELPEQ